MAEKGLKKPVSQAYFCDKIRKDVKWEIYDSVFRELKPSSISLVRADKRLRGKGGLLDISRLHYGGRCCAAKWRHHTPLQQAKITKSSDNFAF